MDIGHSSGPLLTGLVVAMSTYALGFQFTAGVGALVVMVFAAAAFRRSAPGR